ncbi:MAG TPA: GGDEF domain-containing protein, partial [Sulfuricurvum sp.]|nr:GGDEF domain-containing protein [Sulfuricurvum sp.]
AFELPDDQLNKAVNDNPEFEMQIADHEGVNHIFSVKIITLDSSLSYIAVFHDITQFKNTEKKLTKEAETDSLTGLMNRHRLNKELEMALSLVQNQKKRISFIIIDIDNFKRINDTYGHIVGDYALVTLSKICKDKMRATDIVARWGGEEFMIVLYNTDTEQAFKIIDALRETIAKSPFDHFDHLTCSFGLTQMREEDSIETLTKRADGALYHAKETGKNKVVIA